MDRAVFQQAKWYFIKAVIVVACLMLAAQIAPYLPSVLIPLILVAFSLVSTMGALYYTVIDRLHRQYRLAKDGQLSRLNRKWTVRLVVFLIAFLISAIFFILEAPKWDVLEWVLTWLAIPLYYIVFRFMRSRLEREYARDFVKAHAMRWSFWIVGIALCIVYALLSVLLPTGEFDTLRAAFDSVPQPYAASSSALMDDVGKLAWYGDVLASYGLAQVSDGSPIIAFVCRFIIYAGVFFGLVNQFGFCLLDKDEVKSEFQLLPAVGEESTRGEGPAKEEPIRWRYILVIAVVLVAATTLFLAAEFEAAKAKASREHTLIEAFVDEWTDNAVAIADGQLAEIRERDERRQNQAQWISELVQERNETLNPLIDEYYDCCRENVDSYLDWYDGVAGWWAKLWKGAGDTSANDAVKTFKERITEGANGANIEGIYRLYQGRIDTVRAEAAKDLSAEELTAIFGSAAAAISGSQGSEADGGGPTQAINLWRPLDDPATVSDVLLNTGDGADRESMRAKILDLIEQARADAFAQLGE